MGKKPRVAAVIDIGSNGLRLKIAECAKGKLKYIESLTYPLSLGRDTFDTGKISFDKADKTCSIIENFLLVAAQYAVESIAVVSTTAMREATNRDYILDQIKLRTQLEVRVLDDSEEKLYIYRMMANMLEAKHKDSALMVYTGSGNVGIALLKGGRINYTQNIRVGSLRISELFMGLQEYSDDFFQIVDQYLKTYTSPLLSNFPSGIKTFIASGHEISLIAELCKIKSGKSQIRIPRETFSELLSNLYAKSIDYVSATYNISFEQAELLLPSMGIYNNLLEMTQASEIISPHIFLSDAVLFELLYPEEMNSLTKEFYKHTLISAKLIAKKYDSYEAHFMLVEKFAVEIFEKMKKIHGLGSKEKLFLQTAAILHDIGKFINIRDHYRHSYNIIRGIDIFGLNGDELEIVAIICLYHSSVTPSIYEQSYSHFNSEQRVLISKLAAILRLADSLDRSHRQKFSEIRVRIEKGTLQIIVSTNENIDLERWSFTDKSGLFNEVFGMKAIIKKKKVM